MDLNNELELNRIIKAANTPQGKAVVEFFSEQLKTVNYDEIDKTLPLEMIGAKYLAVRKTRDYISKLINLLTPIKGD